MKRSKRIALPFAALLTLALATGAEKPKETPVELGQIQWQRDYDKGIEQARQTGKPICLLFQEVPGCAGCQKYGKTVLTDPLIASAIEEAFIPVAIHNNKGGEDKRILKMFKEPAWNYQVMRFVDADGKDLIPRKDKVWTSHATSERLILALQAAKRPVPAYLTLARDRSAPKLETAVLSMGCYYIGEAKLGALDGVVSTESGWFDRREVVKLQYDPEQISLKSLIEAGSKVRCNTGVFLQAAEDQKRAASYTDVPVKAFDPDGYRPAKESEQLVHLRRYTAVKKIDLSPEQATKINSALAAKADKATIHGWLTLAQRQQLEN